MNISLKEYKTAAGEIILYAGNPNFEKLEQLASGPGDIWHSSFEQGYKNAFPEIVYQTAVFFWYLNDFDNVDECVSWRVNPNHFAVRQSVWEIAKGFDVNLKNPQLQALDFGFRCLRYLGGVPLYSKGLFTETTIENVIISKDDRFLFFLKNFKKQHSIWMIYRQGFWKTSEWKAYFKAKKEVIKINYGEVIPPRKLNDISGNPAVSYIIPTMFRQEYTVQLLEDLSHQSLLPRQVIIVDATPHNERNETAYSFRKYPFEVTTIWQQSKGSCRARNEAIEISIGDFIVFGDDDIRIPKDFIENHVRLLETYHVGACNGLDVRADVHTQDLNDLEIKLEKLGKSRWKVGAAPNFSNANSCVKREFVNHLIGNDINFDGGYGEDSDFGLSLAKLGVTVLYNPFSANLHLKPPSGGYRFWGTQSKLTGKNRKKQPWELDVPVKSVRPVPSPTIMYGILKQYSPEQFVEYKHKHFANYIFKGSKSGILYRILRLPYKNLQFEKSVFYAKQLLKLGTRHQ